MCLVYWSCRLSQLLPAAATCLSPVGRTISGYHLPTVYCTPGGAATRPMLMDGLPSFPPHFLCCSAAEDNRTRTAVGPTSQSPQIMLSFLLTFVALAACCFPRWNNNHSSPCLSKHVGAAYQLKNPTFLCRLYNLSFQMQLLCFNTKILGGSRDGFQLWRRFREQIKNIDGYKWRLLQNLTELMNDFEVSSNK